MQNIPKQRLSFADKSKDDFAWAKKTIDQILSYAPQSSLISASGDYERMLSNYRLYNNEIDQKDLERECNPLGLNVGQFKDLVQPYNKTYNKIQRLLGDELRRPFNYKAVLVDAGSIRQKLEVRDTQVKNYIYAQIQETIKSISSSYTPELVDTMVNEILPPEEINKQLKYTYRDRREILSTHILSYLERFLSLKDIKNDAFKHGLISGKEFVYVGELNDEPTIQVLNSLSVFYHKSSEIKWVQDGFFAGSRTYMTSGEILDKYARFLTDEQIKKIEQQDVSSPVLPEFKQSGEMKYYRDDEDRLMGSILGSEESSYEQPKLTNILVQHVEWRSQKKIGFLSFVNEYGDLETSIVSEDFVVPENATTQIEVKDFGAKTKYKVWEQEGMMFRLTWDYIPEVWTATRIGSDIYCMIGPKAQQFRSKDNPYQVSLGYHGLVYNAMNASPIALMDRMKPFQYLYFIVMHKLKKLIAQDQGKVFHFDVSMIDPSIGLEKSMYYLKELNIDFYNPLMNADSIGQSQRSGKVTHSTDMSNMQNILNYIGILNSLDQQISDVAGIPKGMEGQLGAQEAVTNAQSNLQMGAIVVEVYFQAHNKLWEKVLTSLVAAARSAWKNKKVIKQFVLDDLSMMTLEMSQDEPQDYEVGVFIADAGKEHEMFQALRQMADGLLNTNRATFSDLIKLYEASSTAELKRSIEASEEKQQQQAQQSQQAEIQAAQQAQQAEQDFKFEFQAREQEHEVLIHQIDAFKFQQDQDQNDNGIPDFFEIEKFKTETGLKKEKLSLEKEKLKQDKELREKEIAAKKAKSNS